MSSYTFVNEAAANMQSITQHKSLAFSFEIKKMKISREHLCPGKDIETS